jgi:hypothetical protein
MGPSKLSLWISFPQNSTVTFYLNFVDYSPSIGTFWTITKYGKKYDGHAWCELQSNLKNSFGLGFWMRKCLGVIFRESSKEMKNMVTDEVYCIIIITTLAIALYMSKTFISRHLFNEDGEGPMVFFQRKKTKSNFVKVWSFVLP